MSRQAGREALAAFQPTLQGISPEKNLEINFASRLILVVTDNLSVKATLEILEKISDIKFIIK